MREVRDSTPAVRNRARIEPLPLDPARAADILNNHLLTQRLGQTAGDDAAEHIGAAAGREWNHHGHRPIGPVLRRRARSKPLIGNHE